MCVCVCVRMLENDPQSFLEMPEVDTIVQYASMACTMLHPDAQASALRFLSVLTDVSDAEVSFSIVMTSPRHR